MVFDLSGIISLIFLLQVIMLSFVILLDNRDAAKTYSWILLIVLLPVVSILIFIFFGRNWRKNKRRRRENADLYKRFENILKPLTKNSQQIIESLPEKRQQRIAQLATAAPYMTVVQSDSIRLYTSGAEKFADLLDDIKSAKHCIHIEYYIIISDKLVSELIEALCERARNGVEVRVFYDWLGSYSWKMRDKMKLRKAGAMVASGRSPLDKINYRSHRKIISIDGRIAYIGGMNLSSWYVDGGKRFNHWRDNHLRISGNFAVMLDALFSQYWYRAKGEELFKHMHIPKTTELGKRSKKIVQLVHSGADTQWDTIKQIYEKMISSAEQYIWLQSPYFIPQTGIYSCLINAALAGLEVNLIVAGVSDNIMSKNAGFTYFRDLLNAGANIYMYTEGFMHCKALSIDGSFCTVGSANLDPRSMEFNYEANAIIYDKEFTAELEKQCRNDLKNCRKLTIDEIRDASIFLRLKRSFFRLLSPLL
ncbi:MAG: cardiolipin synthase [Calditrichaeota bacterium]|nr:cardiolipin synthase [Calditrichota bacterium]